ncbi:LysM peptidoglycan-binding domain-containing protein [Anaerocolumna sp. MB42-C2]|uniref:LysM peptidoglycan-binding domain-containing protein n=1 Tax=Anaerocolumna sp. MB42-C2 TaxID=3070997 RepID=UPI0027DF19FA|nr:LysM peptidoglycan-binding domain-containing protein [Anaerocolumna sp. MB42-C2]WMJ87452.1 LysM peptidoglycan-binding domain-containing protein [Anaerocolumna sp. MB42-C2]
MIIHVVQPGETVNSISAFYNIPAERLIQTNGINNPENLAIGQAIAIIFPETLYTVQAGDTMGSIAEKHGISLLELLRNNPYLSGREYIYTGETLVINYQKKKIRKITTSGYAFTHINLNTLRESLPFLSYLTIFNYKISINGELVGDDDSKMIQMAKEYGVAPMMFVSTLTSDGKSNTEVFYSLIHNPEVQVRVINTILHILHTKGYYGVNIYIEYINLENIDIIADNIKKAADIFHSEGFKVSVTVSPKVNIESHGVSFDKIDYSKFAAYVDSVVFTSYEWGMTYSYTSSVTPVIILKELLNYAISIIPPEKIIIGIIPIGYDWLLPYVPGFSIANAVTSDSAIQLAADSSIPIQYNEQAQAPYFFYVNFNQEFYLLWFKDARSFNAIADLLSEYGLKGLAIWTIMDFNTQLWFVLNTEYEIERVQL